MAKTGRKQPAGRTPGVRRTPWFLLLSWASVIGLLAGAGIWIVTQPVPPAETPTAPPPALSLALPPAPLPPAPPPAAPALPEATPPDTAPSAAALPPAATPPGAPPSPPPLPRRPATPALTAPPTPPQSTIVAAATPLAPAPDTALQEAGPFGPLPMVGRDGREPWRAYARPFSDPGVHPRIALVVGALGLNENATEAAIQRLPPEVTLAFMPYARDLPRWLSAARAAGHEVMLNLPMEPERFPDVDPGPQALMIALTPTENVARLDWIMARGTGYVGLASHMGSRVLASEETLRPALRELKRRGLLFVDSRSSQKSVGMALARDMGLPAARNDTFIDNEVSRPAVDARLEELEKVAKLNGATLGMGFGYPLTIERVVEWSATLKGKGLSLAPVSAVVNRQPLR